MVVAWLNGYMWPPRQFELFLIVFSVKVEESVDGYLAAIFDFLDVLFARASKEADLVCHVHYVCVSHEANQRD